MEKAVMFKRLVAIVIGFLLTTSSFAGQVQTYKDYNAGDSFTDIDIDGNLNNIRNVLNGNLDNTNANTVGGFRFFEVRGSLPTAGTQGRVVYRTSDNTLWYDNGSTFLPFIATAGTPSLADILVYDGTTWNLFTEGDAGKFLMSNGTGSQLTYSKVNLASSASVTGNLPVANLNSGTNATGGTVWKGNGVWDTTCDFRTSSGTFTASTPRVYLTLIGGGGGAGAAAGGQDGGGGGGGGESILLYPYNTTVNSNYTVTVGAGGAAGTGSGDGVAGGTTTFDTISVSGGAGGTGCNGCSGTAAGGAGGSANSMNASTTTGGSFYSRAGGNGAAGSGSNKGGGGGGSSFGAGGSGGTAGQSGTAGTGYGSGGGGESGDTGGTTSGAGTSGFVLICS